MWPHAHNAILSTKPSFSWTADCAVQLCERHGSLRTSVSNQSYNWLISDQQKLAAYTWSCKWAPAELIAQLGFPITDLSENWLAIVAWTRHHFFEDEKPFASWQISFRPRPRPIAKRITGAILWTWYWWKSKEHICAGTRVNQPLDSGLLIKAARKRACWSCTIVLLH